MNCMNLVVIFPHNYRRKGIVSTTSRSVKSRMRASGYILVFHIHAYVLRFSLTFFTQKFDTSHTVNRLTSILIAWQGKCTVTVCYVKCKHTINFGLSDIRFWSQTACIIYENLLWLMWNGVYNCPVKPSKTPNTPPLCRNLDMLATGLYAW